MSYTDKEIFDMTFKRLNSIYSDIEGINVLSDLVGDNEDIQDYVVSEVQGYETDPIPKQDKKNRTVEEGDKYFWSLTRRLYFELRLRGMFQEANNIIDYRLCDVGLDGFPNKRMTEKQFIRALRVPRVSKAIELGMNKTNAVALSRVIEQLCFEVYS